MKQAASSYLWKVEIRHWVKSRRNIDDALCEDIIQFFENAFVNTVHPEKAWFGKHGSTVSLVVGGIFLAAIISSGKDRGVWLLVENAPQIEGWKSWVTKSTQDSFTPLKWLRTKSFDHIKTILDDSAIWLNYAAASQLIFNFPVYSADRDDTQEERGKHRLSQIYQRPQNNPVQDLEQYRASYENLPKTEREAIVQSRLGQGKFRTQLIDYWSRCAVTGCEEIRVLRASHIKPWRVSDTSERLDVYNGLLLTPNLDVLFDIGLISFNDNGRIITNPSLTNESMYQLGLQSDMRIQESLLTERHQEYLYYHRMYVFKK